MKRQVSDQTVRVCRPVCAFVFRKQQSQVFSLRGPYEMKQVMRNPNFLACEQHGRRPYCTSSQSGLCINIPGDVSFEYPLYTTGWDPAFLITNSILDICLTLCVRSFNHIWLKCIASNLLYDYKINILPHSIIWARA